MARARVGISGWTYAPWRGEFYPKGLAHKRELAYASSKLDTIEINGTFYSLQRPTSFAAWYAETPDDFVFSVKGGRFITHMKKLAGVETALATFFASGVLALKDKLGPVLWQLPPNLGFDPARLAAFFALLPRSSGEAVWLARHHDERIKGRAYTGTDLDRPMRHALEVRHNSFLVPEFLNLLREHHIAIVVADTAGKWPQIRELTTDFGYLRLHGADELYVSGYTPESLDDWAALVRGWRDAGHDVFTYFDNDVKVRAPYDAIALAERLAERVNPT
jgi:uncharacterized protein YecE (DUF72 family)